MSANDFFANIPMGAPPPGQKTNFDAPAPDADSLWGLAITSVTLAFLAVTIRLYVKRFVSKQMLSWDDGACVLALVLAILHTCVILKELDYGLGKHMWDIRAISFTHDRLLLMTSANLIIALNMLCVRIAVLSLYQRLFGVYETSKKLIYVAYAISVVIAIPEVGVVIGRMSKCSSALAGMTIPLCKTKAVSIAVITFSILGVLTDAFIYSIAISRLRLLHVKQNKKIQLTVVFAVGLLALVFGIANLVFVAVHFATPDQLWYAMWVAVFKFLEANVALTCACATFLPAFWKQQRKGLASINSALRVKSQSATLDGKSGGSKSAGLSKEGRDSDEGLVALPTWNMSAVSQAKSTHSDIRTV